jgi:linoleoyl-CoA desaturase
MNLYWVIAKDYRKLIHYSKEDLLKKEKLTLRKAIIQLTSYKLLYFTYVLVLPILFSGVAWQHVVLGFVIMHVMAGLGLAAVFQPAHVMESSEYPVAVDNGRVVESSWAVHQVLNTTNFAPRNQILSWFIGGLNFQIEHHLFPHICHVHYPELSKIVRQTALEHGIPYNQKDTFRAALAEHGRMLYLLGHHEDPVDRG